MNKVTIETIAREANVSVGTVDRALHGRERIKPETKQKILKTAQRLGYQPNKIASALGRQKKYRIGVIMPQDLPQEPLFFFGNVAEGVKEARDELVDYGVEVEILPCETFDARSQSRVLDAIRPEDFDGLAMMAGSDAIAGSIDRLVDQGVPVVTFNSDASASRRLFFVGENTYNSGRMAGTLMGRLLGGRGKVATFVSFFNPGYSMNRRDGFCDALREGFPDIEVVDERQHFDDLETARRLVHKMLQANPDLNGIFSNTGAGTLALGEVVGEYVKSGQYAGDKRLVLVGYDVTEKVEQYLKDGLFDMVFDQEPRLQGYYGVKLLAKHLLEHWTPEIDEFEIRVKIVIRENVQTHSMNRNKLKNILA